MIELNGRKYREYEANGNGGQMLMNTPELQLTVVFTAANYNAFQVWRRFREEFLPQYIIAAVN